MNRTAFSALDPRLPLPDRPVLVLGATGTLGGEAVRALLEHGARVRALVRSPESAAKLPAAVECVPGNLEDPRSLAAAFRGVHAVFFVAPHEDAEEQIAENVVRAAEHSGARLVFAGVHVNGANRLVRAVWRAVYHRLAPHYTPKMRLSERVRSSRARPVILMPANFYQNDDLAREALQAGVFPFPLARLPRVDTRDVGDAAARALLDARVPDGAYSLVGPGSLDAAASAANWAAALGRPVRATADLDLVDRLLDATCPPRKAVDFKKTFRVLANFSAKTTARDLRETGFLLGRAPRGHAEYARETARAWGATVPATASVRVAEPVGA